MKKMFFTFCFFSFIFFSIAQTEWQLTGSTPEGGGITDILFHESTGDLFAVTASNNWPSGDDGGIRRSSDEGNTWTNVIDAYIARTIRDEPDGNLYASIWQYPQDEGLYRSSNNGDDWELLVSVPSGNNIFSSALKENAPNNIIFAGTRTGVYRSLDNGTTWNYANVGIPADSWVRSMEVGPNGTIAAGTTNGLFVSFDDGDNWSKVGGDYENETIVCLAFEDVSTKDDDVNLYAGTAAGVLIVTTYALAYTAAILVTNFGASSELTRLKIFSVTSAIITSYYLISMYSATGGDFVMTNSGFNNWQQYVNGLQTNFVVSMFTAALVVNNIKLFMGLFGGVNGGAKVYKGGIDTQTGNHESPYANNGLQLMQNFPNPFKNSTRIGFQLEKSGHTILELYDVAGKKIRTLYNEYLNQGSHHINLTNTGLDAGMYYYTLYSGQVSVTKKLLIQ